ncbi:MAG TPA: hypothetical protein ENN89_03110, partial [Synergistetes bacterium]|nr:hypothetical protein [Synergistota bacterium]
KEDILAVYDLPAHCRKKMRTTNMTERTNEEIRRRERVIRIFPNDASATMLAGAYLQELSEEWISGRRYMDMTEFQEAKAEEEQKEKASGKQPVYRAQPKAVAVNM